MGLGSPISETTHQRSNVQIQSLHIRVNPRYLSYPEKILAVADACWDLANQRWKMECGMMKEPSAMKGTTSPILSHRATVEDNTVSLYPCTFFDLY
jgi:hypothetical protein